MNSKSAVRGRRVFETRLAQVANVITLGNVGFSLCGYFRSGKGPTIPAFPVAILPLKVILFVLLETLISGAFALLIVKLEAHYDRSTLPQPIIAVSIFGIAILSPWTSIFNVQWMLLDPGWYASVYLSALVLGCSMANLIFSLLLCYRENYWGIYWKVFWMHGLAFAFVGILLYADRFYG